MGQKVNPHGLRVGVIKDWDSHWYAREDKVGDLVVEDYNIRKYLKNKLYAAGIAKIEIERSTGKVKMSKSLAVSPEINLLGKTVDEAIAELDKYLDDAYIAHVSPVRIVHGKGTGALRSGIHSYLKRQKHVKSYRLGAFGEGDAGVTIVEFK